MADYTPSQTVGPFFAYSLTAEQYGYQFKSVAGAALAGAGTEGLSIRIEGRIFDGAGEPVNDAMVEIWQADAQGRYAHPAAQRSSNAEFTGFGRCGTGTAHDCSFSFDTIRPGAPVEGEAPHINITVFMRGLLRQVHTRLYFADEEKANAADPVLALVPQARRHTLIAERSAATAPLTYRFDIHMQGARETVFFAL
ncbi:MAG: protocatechuate 3,4-dioxygenase subunit alpha [Gammaproteobacteria bacterium]|nr:protocatechuate 3,4-dioxygenase subunit alpha [Gammaproteobacteria bacterium]